MLVASWNLNGRTGKAASKLGLLLGELGGADIVLLQEVARGATAPFCSAAALDWCVHAGEEFADLLHALGRSGARCVAIAGRGSQPRGVTTFPDVPLPEKVLAAWIDVGAVTLT